MHNVAQVSGKGERGKGKPQPLRGQSAKYIETYRLFRMARKQNNGICFKSFSSTLALGRKLNASPLKSSTLLLSLLSVRDASSSMPTGGMQECGNDGTPCCREVREHDFPGSCSGDLVCGVFSNDDPATCVTCDNIAGAENFGDLLEICCDSM